MGMLDCGGLTFERAGKIVTGHDDVGKWLVARHLLATVLAIRKTAARQADNRAHRCGVATVLL